MMYVCYQRENQPSELLAGGTVRFKIHDWLRTLGHTGLSKNGVELGTINVRHLAREEVQVMHMTKFSFEALRISKRWEKLWNERIFISKNQIMKKAG
jgi:hypothetical protein